MRLIKLLMRNRDGARPIYGGQRLCQTDPYGRDLILFHEYFQGDNGAGLGASHQSGWATLVAKPNSLFQLTVVHGCLVLKADPVIELMGME